MGEGERCEIKDVYVGKAKTLKTRIILYKLQMINWKKEQKNMLSMIKKGIEKSDNAIELLGISIYITNIKE